jgi:hypothetical protein
MSLDACANLVQRGDPDRFRAVMAAPAWARGQLLPLYAFNLEVARAPWLAQEPLVAEMRLQWWRDTLAEPVPRAHEVAGPLHALIRDAGLPVAVLDRLVAARRWDCWREPFDDAAALETYLEDTGGGLMWLAARARWGPRATMAGQRQWRGSCAQCQSCRRAAAIPFPPGPTQQAWPGWALTGWHGRAPRGGACRKPLPRPCCRAGKPRPCCARWRRARPTPRCPNSACGAACSGK